MNSSTEFRKYGGNGALYLIIDRSRQRRFLRRNIKQALDQHAHALRAPQSSTNNGMCEDACEKAWSAPDSATMAALNERVKPVLRVDVKHLFPTGANSDLAQSRVKTKTYAAPCRLMFKVYHLAARPRPGADRAWEDIYTDVSRAMVQAWRNGDGEEFFSISMDKPVFITADQLKVQVPISQANSYRILMAHSYRTTISIVFDEHKDMKEALSIMNPQENPLPGTPGKLNAKMSTLLDCAEDGIRSPLYFTSGGKSYSLGFDMSVDAGWEAPKETSMQLYNRALRFVRGEQLLSPISEPSTPASVTRLSYWFCNQVRPRTIPVEGFLCLFCDRRDYHSLDRLYHHFKSEHDMFTFKLHRPGADARACLQCDIEVEVDISDRYSDPRVKNNNIANPRDIHWVAPLKPFDLEAYLRGDESWIKTGLGLKKKLHPGLRIAPLPQGAVEPKKPIEVLDMPIVERKRHRVPKAPSGLRFYRSDSKRLLVEGEFLSESDDEISENWLKLRRNLATKDAEVATPAKIFMMKWDDYMQDEHLCGDTHLGDAVVRFARKYRSWLKTQARMGNEFLRKTSELYSDSIICSEVFRACIDFIDGDGNMMDTLAASTETRKHQPTPTSEPNGSSSRQSDSRMKRKYIPGGPGGGGKFLDVLDDDRKRRSKKARPSIDQENSMHSNQDYFVCQLGEYHAIRIACGTNNFEYRTVSGESTT
ncbi:hypothetical protein SLS58_001973 [Diplodia intermedia]|uniref:Polycomb protein VEFS-Box domain-containing protein n=1 Tax=Diplodia intermedia TaxID=856260 RepID=A0ABR3U0C1_9PEZI